MYDISLDNFQGPMDLLLHLIKKKKMNIMEIKLEILIDEYLNYIKACQTLNLNVASSYLVMSSELIEIKSRMLLPNNEINEETPEENFVNRLIEYDKYKNMVATFKEFEQERLNYKTKSPSNILEYKEDEIITSSFEVNDLVEAYKKFLKRVDEEKPLSTKVTKKEISVDKQIIRIRDKFKLNKRINFVDLFEKRNKSYIIATFLAILEMASKKEILIIQDNNFCDIVCEVIE